MEKTFEKATFGAGCFWGVEALFKRVDGVVDIDSGYMGGSVKDPSYEDVSTGMSGHAEVVQIVYDRDRVTFEQLVAYFWRLHNPTTANRQGVDIGPQYRSVIFYHSEEQRKIAENSKRAFDESMVFQNAVVTEIVPVQRFYKAEEYHQDFYDKHMNKSLCHVLRDE